MGAAELLLAFTIGTASLAVWSFVRWPALAPTSLRSAMLRLALAVALLHGGGTMLAAGISAAPQWAPVLLVAAVVPVLTFAFLASIWFMKVVADQMRGAF